MEIRETTACRPLTLHRRNEVSSRHLGLRFVLQTLITIGLFSTNPPSAICNVTFLLEQNCRRNCRQNCQLHPQSAVCSNPHESAPVGPGSDGHDVFFVLHSQVQTMAMRGNHFRANQHCMEGKWPRSEGVHAGESKPT